MLKKRKICVVVTSRPSYSRIKTAMDAIKKHPNLELQTIIAGSALLDKYGSAIKNIEADGFDVNEKVYVVLDGENPTAMAKTTGLAVMELANIFYNLKPDAVITIADRFETIATSIAATYQNIPLIHIQGGERTGSIDEKVRHANTKLADIHLTATENAKNRVIKMGENPDFVFNTGCPSVDLARQITQNSKLDFNPVELYGGVGNIKNWQDGYLVVMQHPVTTEYSMSNQHITETLKAIHKINMPTFWFWPNMDAGSDGTSRGIRTFREIHNPENIRFFKNMKPNHFLKLIKNAKVLIGNSSVGIRESSFLGIPVVNVGIRQNNRERGKNVLDTGYNTSEILNCITKQINHGPYKPETIYGDGNSGVKIAEILAKIELNYTKSITY